MDESLDVLVGEETNTEVDDLVIPSYNESEIPPIIVEEGSEPQVEETVDVVNEEPTVESDGEGTSTQEIVLPSWTLALKDIPQPTEETPDPYVLISEFNNQQYRFEQLRDPDGNATDYYKVFCKDANYKDSNGNMVWIPLNGLLSKRYHVANMDGFIDELKNQVTIIGDADIHHEPFELSWKGKTEQTVTIFPDEMAKLIFSVVAGIDVDNIEELQSVVEISCSNTYNGTKALRVDYVVKTGAVINGGQQVDFVDYFTLCNHSHKIIHNSGLTDISANLTNVQNYLDMDVEVLKQHMEGIDGIIAEIAKKFKKTSKEKFLSLWENLAADHKNLFFALILASIVLSSDYSTHNHLTIRTAVDKIFEKVFRGD